MDIQLNDLLYSPFSEFSRKLRALCAPLFKHYDFNYFDYARFYHNGTCWSLFTDPQYVNYFAHHPVYTKPPFLRPTGAYLWAGYIPPEFLDIANEGFNYYHGLTLVTHSSNHIEVVNIAAPASNSDCVNVFLNNQSFIRGFIKYVINEVTTTEKHLTSSQIIMPTNNVPIVSPLNDEKKILVINEISTLLNVRKNHNLVLVGETLIALSEREKECLHYLKLGFSNKLIARRLNISHRTIEKYFNKIYIKCNLNGRRELMQLLMQR